VDLIRFSIANPVKVTVGVILLLLFGVISLRTIPIQLTPDIERPVVTVRTEWPGRSPEEIERSILIVQEDKLKTLQGLYKMTSTAQLGRGFVTLEFNVGYDMSRALQEIANRLDEVRAYPVDVTRPVVRASDTASDDAIAVCLLQAEDPDFDVARFFRFDGPVFETGVRADSGGCRDRHFRGARPSGSDPVRSGRAGSARHQRLRAAQRAAGGQSERVRRRHGQRPPGRTVPRRGAVRFARSVAAYDCEVRSARRADPRGRHRGSGTVAGEGRLFFSVQGFVVHDVVHPARGRRQRAGYDERSPESDRRTERPRRHPAVLQERPLRTAVAVGHGRYVLHPPRARIGPRESAVGWQSGGADSVAVSAQRPADADHRRLDPDLDHRDVRGDGPHGPERERHLAGRIEFRRGDGRGQCDRGVGEHRPSSGVGGTAQPQRRIGAPRRCGAPSWLRR
jgi:hypothetical protein